MRLVSLGRDGGLIQTFGDLFSSVQVTQNLLFENIQLSSDDVVLFCGGEDINPSFYGQEPSRYNGSQGILSLRDTLERSVFTMAKEVGASMLGICRGSQLLCALSGGSLVQHATNHGRDHLMRTNDDRVMEVTSTHHQMMNPFGTKHELIGWANEKLSNCYLIEGEQKIDMPCEPEVVFFPETKALAIQYHPEYMYEGEEAVIFSRELVKKYLLKE